MQEELARPEDAEWPAWSLYIRNAWSELRDDRHFGSMGGMGRIYWTAIDRYALRYKIAGEAFESFLLFLRAIDDEYMQHIFEKQKEEQDKRKVEK
jgi:hypothetical protein